MAKNTLTPAKKTTNRKSTVTKPTPETVEKPEVKETPEAPVKETSTDASADVLAKAMLQAAQAMSTAQHSKGKSIDGYDGTDTIPCKSVTEGKLILVGSKSGITYTWGNFGDVTEVEYQDLMFLKARHSSFLYSPLFLIEDEELLQTPRFKDLNGVYDTLYAIEMDELCNLSPANFERELCALPSGLQDAVKSHITGQLQAGEFDSIQKVRIMDEVLGTDLMFLVK